jgi:hypothetical protein
VSLIFTGFTQNENFREFVYQGMNTDHSRFEVTVRADLQLIRKYRIAVQELPLLCRSYVDANLANETGGTFTFGEPEMVAYASRRSAAAEEAAKRRKPPSRPPNRTAGSAWRGPAQMS